MYKIEHSAKIKDGHLVMDNDRFRSKLSCLTEGEYIVIVEKLRTDKTIEEWQQFFGAKLSEFCDDIGYSRSDREKIVRPMIYAECLPQIYLTPENISIPFSEITVYTTKILTALGWRRFLESARLWMYSQNGYVM